MAFIEIDQLQTLDITVGGNVTEYAPTGTGGWKSRIMGSLENTAVVSHLTQGAPLITKGGVDTLTITFITGVTLTGGVYCDSYNIATDMETGDPVGYVYNLQSTGVWTWVVLGTGLELYATTLTAKFGTA